MEESIVLTREANEDQVKVAGVNDQGDRHVPEWFLSTTVDRNIGHIPTIHV